MSRTRIVTCPQCGTSESQDEGTSRHNMDHFSLLTSVNGDNQIFLCRSCQWGMASEKITGDVLGDEDLIQLDMAITKKDIQSLGYKAEGLDEATLWEVRDSVQESLDNSYSEYLREALEEAGVAKIREDL